MLRSAWLAGLGYIPKWLRPPSAGSQPLMGMGFGGLACLQGIYIGELFHQEIYALAGGFCFNIGRAGAVIAPYTVGVLASIKGLPYGISATSLLLFLGAITVYLLPERKQRDVFFIE